MTCYVSADVHLLVMLGPTFGSGWLAVGVPTSSFSACPVGVFSSGNQFLDDGLSLFFPGLAQNKKAFSLRETLSPPGSPPPGS